MPKLKQPEIQPQLEEKKIPEVQKTAVKRRVSSIGAGFIRRGLRL